MFTAYAAAAYAKDVDAFTALYDEDVCVFDLWGRWSHQGRSAWRTTVEEWFASLGSGRVVVEFDDRRVYEGSDLTVVHAMVTYRGVAADGEHLHAMRNRLTWTLSDKKGHWRVVHEHTSAPVDAQTLKAILSVAQ